MICGWWEFHFGRLPGTARSCEAANDEHDDDRARPCRISFLIRSLTWQHSALEVLLPSCLSSSPISSTSTYLNILHHAPVYHPAIPAILTLHLLILRDAPRAFLHTLLPSSRVLDTAGTYCISVAIMSVIFFSLGHLPQLSHIPQAQLAVLHPFRLVSILL